MLNFGASKPRVKGGPGPPGPPLDPHLKTIYLNLSIFVHTVISECRIFMLAPQLNFILCDISDLFIHELFSRSGFS